MSDTAADLLAKVATQDAALRSRVISLANRALDEAEFLMQHGDPRTKNMLVNKFLSIFAKQLDSRNVDEELEELKKAVLDIRAAVAGRTLDATSVEIGPGEPEEVDQAT